MLTRTGLLIALVLVALFLAGCGEAKAKFENDNDVIKAAEKHTFTDCNQKAAPLIGATSGRSCLVYFGNVRFVNNDGGGRVNIYVFDGDAKNLCQKNAWCQEGAKTYPVKYTANAAIFGQDNSTNTTNTLTTLIADIED